MAKVSDYLQAVDFQDKQFVGTIALRSEELALPDGSKMALGIDGGHWVLIYQSGPGARFTAFSFDQHEHKITVDQKPGGEEEYKTFKQLVRYFLAHARCEDLTTILPPQV